MTYAFLLVVCTMSTMFRHPFPLRALMTTSAPLTCFLVPKFSILCLVHPPPGPLSVHPPPPSPPSPHAPHCLLPLDVQSHPVRASACFFLGCRVEIQLQSLLGRLVCLLVAPSIRALSILVPLIHRMHPTLVFCHPSTTPYPALCSFLSFVADPSVKVFRRRAPLVHLSCFRMRDSMLTPFDLSISRADLLLLCSMNSDLLQRCFIHFIPFL
ncbi:hypothetical protein PAPYR_9284 [Paratrimastix pyriformis]|uniref:Secreted protein n=1 Tax=Paratrimastix pyriformis TaxID=342808 RepID=A0ABQ8UFV4_9EUKA|nr:hypothetical protein PAPYR_9284 [Paratrimastix pyriformis]